SCTSTEPALSRLPPAVGLRARGTRDRTCTCNTPVLGRRPLLVGIPWRGPPDEDRTRLNPVDSRASSPEDNEGKKMKSRRRDSNSALLLGRQGPQPLGQRYTFTSFGVASGNCPHASDLASRRASNNTLAT